MFPLAFPVLLVSTVPASVPASATVPVSLVVAFTVPASVIVLLSVPVSVVAVFTVPVSVPVCSVSVCTVLLFVAPSVEVYRHLNTGSDKQ